VLLGLRTVEGVALDDLAILGRTADAEPLAGLIADGFLAVEADRLRATAAGRPVLDGVLRALLV
jgi:oxygen-independent coproporphyrinogen-3 oxidase